MPEARDGLGVASVRDADAGGGFSAVQTERARGFWSELDNLEFVCADALAFLDEDLRLWDVIYSTWGAVWFTDPDALFPRALRRLAPGGILAFSHREPIVGQYGAQRMGGKWLESRETELTVLRWQHTPEQWTDLLKRHGFTDISAKVIPAPDDAPGTLLITAKAPARTTTPPLRSPRAGGIVV
ncbi:methyltransferase domain-containing protein [Streptomyces sp. NBC_01565]|uniref:methyltransferase domain-containing protein n=1 Tax=Streptomyces sp. NBC_01565 TaxID=2975881 RepID=UPI002256B166|nr:methyltransferase domain-containing protein [Streptomyces sp. NBC_01565]MCX4546469.1 class I SAM-dependent methyltransferase [Streptomyces sp. NBC_01565]